MSQFPDKPLISTPTAIALIAVLLALKWTFWPDDDLELLEDHTPAPQLVLDASALETILGAANHVPLQPATVVVVPCDDPAAGPMPIGATGASRALSAPAPRRYCVIEIGPE